MSLLAFLVLTQNLTPKAVFDRYAAFRAAHPVISVDWNVARGAQEIAHGTLALDGSKRMLFKATNGTSSYSLSETELGGIEIVPNARMYDEFPALRAISVPTSRVGQEASFIPAVLLRSQIFNPNLKYKLEPNLTVGGVSADVVSWEVSAQGATFRFEVAVDSAGRVVQFSRAVGRPAMGGGPMGGGRPGGARPRSVAAGAPKAPGQSSPSAEAASSKVTWTIFNYRWNVPGSLSAFYTPLPKGYVPYAIPASSELAIEVDQQFPATPWKAGGRMVNLNSVGAGKPSLILVTSPDSLPNQAAIAGSARLRAGISGAVVEVVSLARTAAAAKGLPFDATGKAAQALGETSTPLYVLIDAKGKITNLWTGYDPAEESQFVKEVQAAIKTVRETPAETAPGRTSSKTSSLR